MISEEAIIKVSNSELKVYPARQRSTEEAEEKNGRWILKTANEAAARRSPRKVACYFGLLFAVMLVWSGAARAQSALDGFNPGANDAVYVLAVQPDGKILVGGYFTTLGGGGTGTTTRNRIGRLNPDGSLDTSFDPGTDGGVLTLAVQPDGKILAGGYFTTLGGGGTGTTTRNRIGRLNLDGSLDASFDPGANNAVYALAVQPDGKILVGGNFTTLGGGGTGTTTRNYIGRLNPDGSLDASFDPGANGPVFALAVQPDGKILVGGNFTTLGGGGTGTTTRNRIGRLNPDGSLDTSFDPGAGSGVFALAVEPDGKILAGGGFTTLGGGGTGTTTRNYIGRLNLDGSLDASFDPGAGGPVFVLAVEPDGKILVGGNFTTLGGGGTGATTRINIARVNPDGSLDASFDPGANFNVYALAVQWDGKILAGGDFSMLGGGGTGTTTRNRIGRLNPDGSLDTSFDPGANGDVYALAVQPDGKILAGGFFTTLGGGGTGTATRNDIGSLNPDGSLDASFDPGADGGVFALAVEPDGKILAGGYFTTLGGGGAGTTTRNFLGRLTNGEAALQDLGVDSTGAVITWSRSGAGPEVASVTFESSSDGTNYSSLGAGTRITGGWQLSGVALPSNQNIFFRARGFFPTGESNGSRSIVESVREIYLRRPNVSIDDLAAASSVEVGSNAVYTVTVENAGPTTASQVEMTDALPGNVVSISAPLGWSCTSSVGSVVCSKVNPMEVGETATFTLTANIDCGLSDGTALVNTAAHSYAELNPSAANNTATVTLTATNPAGITPASAKFGPSGGTGFVGVRQAANCAWSATSASSFVTLTGTASGSGNGTVSYTVAPNTTAGLRSGALMIAGFPFTVTELAVGESLVDVPSGGVDDSTETPDTNPTTTSGYAVVNPPSGKSARDLAFSNGMYATAVISLTQNGAVVSEVGVPASPPTTDARLFVDDRTNVAAKNDGRNAGTVSVDTGVAVVNRNNTTANLTFTLRGPDGTVLATGHGTLSPGNHRAQFIDQLSTLAPDFVLPGDFAAVTQFGTLEVASDQPVSVLGLRLVINQRGETLLTTTPAADLKQPLPFGTAIFPQMADGGGYQTTVLLMNPTLATAMGTLQFLDNTGAPLTVHPTSGEAATSFRYSIQPNGVFVFETDGTPSSVNVGSAEVIPDVFRPTPVGAGVFSYTPARVMVTQSGVRASVPTTHARIYVDVANHHDTGLALTNPTKQAETITLQVYQSDGVTTVGSPVTVNLPANGHTSAFVDQLITDLPAGFTGVVDISSPTPFAALALRSLVNTRGDFLLTLLPVADYDTPAPTPIVFPQIADGGGYQTQILLINTQTTNQTALISFFDDNGNPLDVLK